MEDLLRASDRDEVLRAYALETLAKKEKETREKRWRAYKHLQALERAIAEVLKNRKQAA